MNDWERALRSRIKKIYYNDFEDFSRVLSSVEYRPDYVRVPQSLEVLARQLGNCFENIIQRN